MQPIIKNSYLVELNVGASVAVQKQVNFQFVPQLERKQIYAVQVFSSTNVSLSPNGATVASAAALADVTVTFMVGINQEVVLYALTDLNPLLNSGFIRMFNNKLLNLTKSFITIQSVATIAANQSLLFNFIYQ